MWILQRLIFTDPIKIVLWWDSLNKESVKCILFVLVLEIRITGDTRQYVSTTIRYLLFRLAFEGPPGYP